MIEQQIITSSRSDRKQGFVGVFVTIIFIVLVIISMFVGLWFLGNEESSTTGINVEQPVPTENVNR